MKIVLVGAPNTGKRAMAEAIAQEFGISYNNSIEWGENVVGDLADYRTELALASKRVGAQLNDDECVFTHTILDNLAYTARRLVRGIEQESVSDDMLERYAATLAVLTYQTLDSFKFDVLFYVVTDDEQGEALAELLEELKLNYISLEDDEETNTKNAIETVRLLRDKAE